MTDTESEDFLRSLMEQAADAAGEAILPFFRAELEIEDKSRTASFDPVTAGDRAGEQAIRDLLRANVPGHAVLGEEFGADKAESAYRWVIDPIDGTRGFILGLPTWGTLIGLERDGAPWMGLMNQPYVGDRFYSDGTASFYRHRQGTPRRLQTRATATLATAHLATTTPEMFTPGYERDVFDAIRSEVRDCRYGTDCYAYCLLAAGLIDIVVEAGLQPYDITALVPVIENAGGRVTSWAGTPAHEGGRVVAAANAALHREALDLIESLSPKG